MTGTTCHFGDRRPWFVCSGRANGRHCGRRVGVVRVAAKHSTRISSVGAATIGQGDIRVIVNALGTVRRSPPSRCRLNSPAACWKWALPKGVKRHDRRSGVLVDPPTDGLAGLERLHGHHEDNQGIRRSAGVESLKGDMNVELAIQAMELAQYMTTCPIL